MVRYGSITSRREARVLVLQSLCESDIVPHEVMDVLDRLVPTAFARIANLYGIKSSSIMVCFSDVDIFDLLYNNCK